MRLTVLIATALVTAGLSVPASAAEDYRQVVDLTFPTERSARFSEGYDDPRSGGRIHKATDLMAPKMTRLYAAVDGTVCSITGVTEPAPTWGYALSLCGVDGRTYRYLHVNNDTPGTDDGLGGPEHAYAPGIRQGKAVKRGQWLGWVGDSGNAEDTGPHLHFEIGDDRVTDPYGDHRIDPYPSLVNALARGDVSTDTTVSLDPVVRSAGSDRIGTALALAGRVRTADTVVLAPATTFQEPVVAGPLAAAMDAPLLTTWSDRLDPRVADRVRALGASNAVLVGGLAPAVSDALSAAGVAVERLGGADPYATSAAVAERVWAELGAGRTVEVPEAPASELPARLVTGRSDRTGVRPLQGEELGSSASIWLELEDAVAEVAFELDGREVHVERQAPHDLGGTSDTGRSRPVDLSGLDAGVHELVAVVRLLDGSTARTTAYFTTAGDGPAGRSAVVALGGHPVTDRSWPDGVTASYLGAATGAPVLLVEPSGVRPVLLPLLATVTDAVVVGGESAVPAAVAETVASLTGGVQRLAGATRYSTALAVSEHVVGDRRPDRVYAATAHGWADAITAGPVVAAQGLPLVLVDGAAAPSDLETGAWLNERWDDLTGAVVVGGPAAVGDAALARLARRIT